MRFMDELIPMRLYSSKKKVYMPIVETDKKHNAAIFLMGPNAESNENMMTAPYLHNNNLFTAYYIDKDAMSYINSGVSIEAEEDFDEIEEAALSEGMFHTIKKNMFEFKDPSVIDQKYLLDVYNNANFAKFVHALGIKSINIDKVIVVCHPNASSLQKECPYENKNSIYSYTTGSEIHIISSFGYNEKTMDGPYPFYLTNELISCIMINAYPTMNRDLIEYIAIALSGQVEYYRSKVNKDYVNAIDSDKVKIRGLERADLIYQIYQKKGSIAIKHLVNGDFSDLRNVSGRRTIDKLRAMFESSLLEGNLSTKQRDALDDIDFGIPEKRKYPMPDASHVRAAIRLFNHVSDEDEEELAESIKRKMKKFSVTDIDVGEDNRFYKYLSGTSIHESSGDTKDYKHWRDNPEYVKFRGDISSDYIDILRICDTLSFDEFKKISFHATYQDSKYIEYRKIQRSSITNEPMGFIDVYHFPSDPDRVQITTAVDPKYRGEGVCKYMLEGFMSDEFIHTFGIKKVIWNVHPDNEASKHIAESNGFVLTSDKLDKYGRYTYVYFADQEGYPKMDTSSVMKTESAMQISENSVMLLDEVDSTIYDTKLKKYLYRERLRTNKDVLQLYAQVRARNPFLKRSFKTIKMYKGFNLFVDTSYYHTKFLKNAILGTPKSVNMYFDFINRLMNNDEIFKVYKKITYFFPVEFPNDTASIDSLFDYKQGFNIISIITRLVRFDAEQLKRWAGKDIIFIGKRGYFKVDFANFSKKDLTKFRLNIKKILVTTEVIDDTDEDDIVDDSRDSSKSIAAKVVEKIETMGIKIDDISTPDMLSHLSMEKDISNVADSFKKNTSSAIMILAPNSDTAVSALNDKVIKSNKIHTFYKP